MKSLADRVNDSSLKSGIFKSISKLSNIMDGCPNKEKDDFQSNKSSNFSLINPIFNFSMQSGSFKRDKIPFDISDNRRYPNNYDDSNFNFNQKSQQNFFNEIALNSANNANHNVSLNQHLNQMSDHTSQATPVTNQNLNNINSINKSSNSEKKHNNGLGMFQTIILNSQGNEHVSTSNKDIIVNANQKIQPFFSRLNTPLNDFPQINSNKSPIGSYYNNQPDFLSTILNLFDYNQRNDNVSPSPNINVSFNNSNLVSSKNISSGHTPNLPNPGLSSSIMSSSQNKNLTLNESESSQNLKNSSKSSIFDTFNDNILKIFDGNNKKYKGSLKDLMTIKKED